jgi:hypothetical protein
MNKVEVKNAKIGEAIQSYRDHLEAALAWCNDMSDVGFERPWITVKCKRRECCDMIITLYADGTENIPEHTHRIRLEIR